MKVKEEINYYQILQIKGDAHPNEIKKAFHQLLKRHHPDKFNQNLNLNSNFSDLVSSKESTQLLIEAYSVLNDSNLRRIYDLKILSRKLDSHLQSNSNKQNEVVPQVVDLSEFTQIDDEGDESEGQKLSPARFVLSCRCGGQFLIDEDQMEASLDVVGCDGCSLTIKVEYQSS